jgi:hypothetical protein
MKAVTIIIVLRQYILDNIYSLLSHGPTCQSSLTHMRSALSRPEESNKAIDLPIGRNWLD